MKRMTKQQQQVLQMERYTGGSAATLTCSFYKTGDVSDENILSAIRELYEERDNLRICLKENNGETYQFFRTIQEIELYQEVREFTSPKEMEEQAQKMAHERISAGQQLVRILPIRAGQGTYGIIIHMHHTAGDGWTCGSIYKRFIALITKQNKNNLIPTEECQFNHYLESEYEYYQSVQYRKDIEYWKKTFTGFSEGTFISDKETTDFTSKRFSIDATAQQMDKINTYLVKSGYSFYCIYMSTLAAFLGRLKKQESFCMGTALLNRRSAKERQTMGMFANTVGFNINVSKEMKFAELLSATKRQIFDSLKHMKVNFSQVLEELRAQKNQFKGALYDVYINYQNNSVDCEEEVGKFRWYHCGIQPESLAININDWVDGGVLKFEYDYHIDKFTEERITYLHNQIMAMIIAGIENPKLKIKELPLCGKEERERILHAFNQPVIKTEFVSILSLFKEQAERVPNNVALEFKGSKMTYRELDVASTYVADRLQKIEDCGSYVGLHLRSGFKQIVAIIAALKAGLAYVPLDVSIPNERKDFILDEIEAKVLICDETNFEPKRNVKRIKLFKTEYTEQNLNSVEVKETDPAYILFTSGSTGKPKGVVVNQANLSHYAKVCRDYYGLNQKSRILQQATYAFDIFVEEVFPVLVSGGTVVIFAREESMGFEELAETIMKAKVTMISSTPLMLKELAAKGALNQLDIIISGGDVLKPEYISSLLKQGKRIYNTYGPTEATVCATYYQVKEEDGEGLTLPIGKPITNVQVYVMVDDKLAGIDMPGEICIGGLGVTDGYFKKPQMTAEKFIDNPFGEGKLYRSGDMGYFNAKGEVEYLGRIDNQVKIRGYRIEISEIEEVLKQFQPVEDVYIKLVQNKRGDFALWAYLIGASVIPINDVKTYLRSKLPEYMVPSQFLQVEGFPLNQNGKIDSGNLPELDSEHEIYAAPVTETEKMLVILVKELLDAEVVGRNDDFFNLGGHSLKAMQLVTRIKQVFAAEISLRQIFEKPVICELALTIEEGKGKLTEKLTQRKEQNAYLAAPAQQRLFIVQQIQSKESCVYNMPAALALRGKLDIYRLEWAFQELIRRHEILRTTFHMEDDQVMQHIALDSAFEIEEIALSGESMIAELQKFIHPFNLETGPLFRIGIQNRSEELSYFFFDMHHIISDGLSLIILFEELEKLYRGEALEELPIQYADYSVWMNQQNHEKAKIYWMDKLEKMEERLEFPLDFPRSKVQDYQGARVRHEFSLSLSERIYCLAKEMETTPYVVFASGVFILLNKYTRQNDIVIGTGFAGRSQNGTEKLIGLFVNTVVLRANVNPEEGYSAFLQELMSMISEMFDYQNYPFEYLLENLHIISDPSRHPLFDIMYTYQNEDELGFGLEGMKVVEEYYQDAAAKFDLQFEVVEAKSEGQFKLDIIYNTGLFLPESIKYLFEQFETLLWSITEDAKAAISLLQVVSAREQNQIINEFNCWKGNKVLPKSLKVLFEERVRDTPDKIALATCGEQFTYAQLLEKTKNISENLKKYNVNRGDKVAIIADKSLNTILSILAVICAEAVYVPIDPDAPMERQVIILEDVKAHVKIKDGIVSQTGVEKEEPLLDSDPIAYIMYTSGTTGRPRGVVIRQSSIVRLVEKPTFTELNEDTVILQTGSMAFDAATFEIWGAFLHSAKLVLVTKEEMMDIHILESVINSEAVNFMFITTAFYNFLVDQHIGLFDNIKQLYVGGEKASPQHMKKLLLHNDKIQLSNIYGPTENTTFSTAIPITLDSFRIPIGYPIGDTAAYIMQDDNIVGVGMIGEICLAGDGIAAGYYKQPQLTAEKFIENPFGEGMLYRSGDLGRFLPDGSIEYIGRLDNQVKIRGYRIELQEIQVAATALLGIQEAFVRVVENSVGDKWIAIYIVGEKSYTLDELNEGLSENLPGYMLPHQLYQLKRLPLNQNGKVDVNALPEEEQSARTVIPAQTEMEVLLIDIYEKLLNVCPIGRNDDFFQLGGHSLKAMQVVNILEDKIKVRIGLRDLFAHPQVSTLAKFLEGQAAAALPKMKKALEQNAYRLSSAQKRLYLIQKMQPSAALAYNMPLYLSFHGKIDKVRLQVSLNKLIEKHEILRTNFVLEQGLPVQKIHLCREIIISEVSSEETIEEAFERFVVPFDLEKDLLVRLELFANHDNNYILFDMHHIISDGFSVTILLSEIARLYNGESIETAYYQYKDYSEWMEAYDFREAKAYWQNEVEEMPEYFSLPYDAPRGIGQKYAGNSVKIRLDEETTRLIDDFAISEQLTPYMVFSTAFIILLMKHSGQNNIRIGVPVSGRIHIETENMLGLFVNTIFLQQEIDNKETILDLLQKIKSKTLASDAHQAYPFDRLIEDLKIETDSSRNPLFDVMFSFQNNAPMEMALEGIEIQEIKTIESVTKFDLNLDVLKEGNEYVLDFIYRTDLFCRDTIEILSNHMKTTLEMITEYPQNIISEIMPINEWERDKILNCFSQSEDDKCYRNFSIAERFHHIAKKFPGKVALIDKKHSMTYQELEDQVTNLALCMKEAGGTKGDLAGVYAEQKITTIISILALMELEMAYLLIDVDLPEERLQYLFEDGDVQFYLKGESGGKIEVKNVSSGVRKINHIEGLAYIMYTSGTTGLPKGVQITQENILSFIFGERFITLDEHLRILHTSAMSFDATTFEIFGTMLFGGTFVLAPVAEVVAVQRIKELIEKNRINCIFWTTSLFNYLIDEEPDLFNSVKYLLVGGEKASMKHMKIVKEHALDTIIYNMYGPTETTTFATAYKLPENFDSIPIGVPVMGKDIYILDGSNLCGIGIPGEICIGGPGVAAGYLNNPRMTAEKFIDNPFGVGKLYRSGDIGYFRQDGNIVYLSRADEQVKIRGFRIELSEVEAALKTMEHIRSAVVVVHTLESGDKVLWGYVAADYEMEMDLIKKELRKKVPNYMVPVQIKQLTTIPLNKNGKTDRHALPEIVEVSKKNEAARDDNEAVLMEVMERLLGHGNLNRRDDFFEIGGDSIKAMRLISIIREKGYVLSIEDIIRQRLIHLIAAQMKNEKNREWSQSPYTGKMPLSAIQKEWLSWKFEKNDFFNQGVMFHAKEVLDIQIIRQALEMLISTHDNLRLRFDQNTMASYGMVHSSERNSSYYILENINLKGVEKQNREAFFAANNETIQQKIKLKNGPLMAVIIYQDKDECEMFWAVHHMVIDGVSFRILLEEFISLYSQAKDGRPMEQPTKTAGYNQWVKLQEKYARCEQADLERDYWRREAENQKPIWSNNAWVHSGWHMGQQNLVLSEQLTSQLLNEVHGLYNTKINEVLISGVTAGFAKAFNREEVIVELEGHGRQPLEAGFDLNKTVGWFTSIFPLKVKYNKRTDVFIRGIKERLRSVPNGGATYLALKYSDNPVPDIKGDILFNYLGNFDSEDFGIFLPSKYDTGIQNAPENIMRKPLMLNACIKCKKLHVDISYNKDLITTEQIESYKASVREYFEHFAEYVLSRKKESNMEWMSRLDWDSIDIVQVMKQYDLVLQTEKPIEQQKASFAQDIFLKQTHQNGLPICACVVQLEDQIPRVKVIETINRLIASQPALRQVIDDSGEHIVTYGKEFEWPIPYFAAADSKEKVLLENIIQKAGSRTELFEAPGLMVKHVVIGNEDGTHTVYIFAHHAVWDLTSISTWQSEFEKFRNENNHQLILFSGSRTELLRGNKKTFGQEQMEFMELAKYHMNKLSTNMLNHPPLQPVNSFLTYELSAVKESVIEKPFATALNLMEEVLMANCLKGEKPIPFFLLSHGRNAENQDKIGLFLQLQSLVYKGTKESQEELLKVIQKMWTGETKECYNFEDLAKYMEISVNDMYNMVIKLPVINVTTLLDARFTNTFEERTQEAEAFGETIGSIQLQLRKDELKVVATTYKTAEAAVENAAKKQLLKNSCIERV